MDKLNHQALRSIEKYYDDLPFKGDDFTRMNDIMYFVIMLSVLEWAMNYELSAIMQEDMRSKIEHFTMLHPNIALYRPVTIQDYKNVNDAQTVTQWTRVFDELGYENINIDTL